MTRLPAGGPLALLAGVASGILAGDRLTPGPARLTLGAGGLLVLAALAVRGRAAIALGVVAMLLLSVALTQRAHDGLVHSPLATLVAERADVTITGTLVDDPEGERFTARALVRASTVDGAGAGGRVVLVTAGGDVGPRLGLLSAGDRIELRGWLAPLAGPDVRMRWRHAVARFDAVELVSFQGPSSPVLRVANRLRGLVLGGTNRLPPTEQAVVAGFLLGDTRDVPPEVEDQFRAAGLTHLLAVSGANVAFVLALVAPVLRRVGLGTRLAGGVTVLIVFGTMTRWEPSVLRACVMAGCSMVALFLGRPAAGLRVLAIAALGLLLADPFLLHSVGFLLSCGASAGIAILGPGLATRLRGPRWVREGLGVTLAAQLGVAPVLIPVFGGVPLVALPANLVAVPLAGPLTVWGLVAGAAGTVLAPWAPLLATAAQLPTLILARAVLSIATVAARVPIMVDGRGACALIVLGALAVLTIAVRRASTLRRDAHGFVPARRPDAGPHDARARHGDPESHSRLLLRPRRDVRARRAATTR
jgi:competence protein ComEC